MYVNMLSNNSIVLDRNDSSFVILAKQSGNQEHGYEIFCIGEGGECHKRFNKIPINDDFMCYKNTG